MDAVNVLASKLETMLHELERDGYDTDWLEIELNKEEIKALIEKMNS